MSINPAEITTIRVGELPVGAITVDSKLPVENDTDLEQITGQDLIDFVNLNVGVRQFQIIDLWVDQAYIDDNFDVTGLGTGICDGLAICNGNNGTPPMDGLVSIGYGTTYNVIGAFTGSKEVSLTASNIPKLDITLPVSDAGGGGSPYNYVLASPSGTPSTKTYANVIGQTTPTKVNKIQPSIVLLKCMKL